MTSAPPSLSGQRPRAQSERVAVVLRPGAIVASERMRLIIPPLTTQDRGIGADVE